MQTMIKPPSSALISLPEVKAHLRIDHTFEDLYLEGLVRAATHVLENYVGRSFMHRTYQLIHHRDASVKAPLQSIPLEMPPLVNVIAVSRVVGEKRMDIKRFYLDNTSSIPHLQCSADFPVVEVIYKAGYGDLPSDVPPVLYQGVMLQTTFFYENRQDGAMEPHGIIRSMVQPYRVMRV